MVYLPKNIGVSVSYKSIFFMVLVLIFGAVFGFSVAQETKGTGGKGDSWVAEALQDSTGNVDKVVNALVSLRYYDTLNENDHRVLEWAWSSEGVGREGWSEDILKSKRVRIILAEILWTKSNERKIEYLDYVRSMLKDDREIVRAYAALSVGFMGAGSEIDNLRVMLLEDHEMVAIQAGLGLLSMKQAAAQESMTSALNIVCEKKDSRNVNVCRMLSDHLKRIKR